VIGKPQVDGKRCDFRNIVRSKTTGRERVIYNIREKLKEGVEALGDNT